MSQVVESAKWTGTSPWMELSKTVPEGLSPRAMQKAAGLDWEVEKQPLYLEHKGGLLQSGHFGLVRNTDGKVLDTIRSGNWEPVQNSQAFAFFEQFTFQYKMQIEVVGSVADGKRVFILANMNESFALDQARDDVTESYLLFTNPHQYGSSVNIRLMPIRLQCTNTLPIELSRKAVPASIKFTHWRKFDEIRTSRIVHQWFEQFQEYRETANFLAAKRYYRETLEEYFDECFPYSSTSTKRGPERDALEEYFDEYLPYEQSIKTKKRKGNQQSQNALLAMSIVETQPGAESAPGTWWNAFNAVTYITDHQIGKTADTRLNSAWYGRGRQRKSKALHLAVRYAEAA